MVKVILMGHQLCGKTTLVKELAMEIGGGAGYFTEDFRGGYHNKREGFNCKFFSGEKIAVQLANVGPKTNPFPGQPRPKIGLYYVNVDEFEEAALDSLSNSNLRKAKLVVIDEMGPLMKWCERWQRRIKIIFREWESEPKEGHLIATMHARNHIPLFDELTEMSDVEVIEVNRENREAVKADLIKRLKEKPGNVTIKPSKHTIMSSVLKKIEAAINDPEADKPIYKRGMDEAHQKDEKLTAAVVSIRGEDRRY